MRAFQGSAAFVATLLGLSLLSLPQAQAAGAAGIALDQLDPAPAGDTFVGVPSPFARGSWVVRGAILFDYAAQPLKLTMMNGGSQSMVVSRQGFFDVNASITIQDRLLFSVLLPAAVTQNGDSPGVGPAMLTSPESAQLGDLRLGLRVRMIGDDNEAFQLGIGANLYLPTAPGSSFAGEGAVRAQPQLLAGGRFKIGPVPWVYSAFGGIMVRPSHNPTMITYGAGLGISLWEDRFQFGPEFYAATPVQGSTFTLTDTVKLAANTSTNAELLVGARVRIFRDLMAGWAVGPGLSEAIGTPAVRFVGTFGWTPGLPRPSHVPGDTDGDGIPDLIDACPYTYGPKSDDPRKNGCPVLDDDDDGIPNAEDACPNRWGVRNADPKKNGCPPESKTPSPVEYTVPRSR
jgi:OmpA-OmpF porin, OOP family